MAFVLTDQHIVDYHMLGYTMFRNLIPADLLGRLRSEADKGREIARKVSTEQAQRLQPIRQYGLDMGPFDELMQLPELTAATARLFGEDYHFGKTNLAVLYEPKCHPYCTIWHRDWRDNIPGLDLSAWEKNYRDVRLYNQVNCALYSDACTWVVPGSHLRRDLPAEIKRFPQRKIPELDLSGKSDEERELACLEYCRSMPGAVQSRLDAGDMMVYRNTLWHIGNYVPYSRRATLHLGILTAEYEAWVKGYPRRSAGDYDNPNKETAEYAEWTQAREAEQGAAVG